MMKKITSSMALCGILFASCTNGSQNGLEISNMENPEIINFSTATTRASINTITEVGANGFYVYATEGTSNTFGIAGEKYKLTGTGWNWDSGSKKWPSDANKYPMNFYAFYPDIAPITAVTAGVASITKVITVPADASAQIDYLSAKKENVIQKPQNGRISLIFSHIMTKINLGVIPGEDVTAHIAQAKLMNIANTATYNFVAQNYSGAPTGTESYPYLIADYDLNTGLTATTPAFASTPGVSSEDVAQPLLTTANKHLMLIPQALTALDITNINAATGNQFVVDGVENYLELVYRLEKTNDLIGFEEKEDYPYDNLGTGITITTTDPKYNKSGAYKGALFIKVVFPLSSLTWDGGKGYNYNVKLGTIDSSGGYYIAKTYCDVNGNDTGLPIDKDGDGDIDKDDEINPEDAVSSGDMHFNIEVSKWDETTPSINITG